MVSLAPYRQPIRRDRVFRLLQSEPDFSGASDGVVLYVDDVSVSFDGFKALDHLSLAVDEGELRCIIGPNGAGKTTMMDVITGKTRPDSGRVYFGRDIDLLDLDAYQIARGGIGRKFQKPTVFEALTVLDNIELSLASHKGTWKTLFARVDPAQARRIDEVLVTIGMQDQRHRTAGALSHGEKQWLEIGMLLMQNPRVLLVDEPVAGMTGNETERTAELLTSLAGEHTVIVVEHDMAFVRSIARRVTVLHQGTVLAEGSMNQIQADPHVVEVYLGEEE
ncbi:MAG: urea ABC transporter ATP-binding protein UrtD [Thioalkalivibrio sp.]|nr:urea ABC transporter ATP-binding protein UrtD [Thioalkalivibrio sp.]